MTRYTNEQILEMLGKINPWPWVEDDTGILCHDHRYEESKDRFIARAPSIVQQLLTENEYLKERCERFELQKLVIDNERMRKALKEIGYTDQGKEHAWEIVREHITKAREALEKVKE